MNGLEARNKTMSELLTELRVRLGFIAQGPAVKNNEAALKSFLQEGHDYVFGELMPPVMRKKTIITLSPNSYLYDWHNDVESEAINPGQVLSVWLKVSDTLSEPLSQGIGAAQRGNTVLRTRPSHYDTLNGQLEVWPAPDQAYPLVVEYTASKSRFERHTDRPSVPDRLVFQYALANAKAHYRQPDAQSAAAAFTNLLSREKSQQKGDRRYFAGAPVGGSGHQVVKSASGYTLGV